jgi:hypothetical protein
MLNTCFILLVDLDAVVVAQLLNESLHQEGASTTLALDLPPQRLHYEDLSLLSLEYIPLLRYAKRFE